MYIINYSMEAVAICIGWLLAVSVPPLAIAASMFAVLTLASCTRATCSTVPVARTAARTGFAPWFL